MFAVLFCYDGGGREEGGEGGGGSVLEIRRGHNPLYSYCFIWIHFRYGISLGTIVWESTSVSKEMIAPWNQTTLPNLKLKVGGYIYNANEFGLFYQCLHVKTYHLSSEKRSGGKSSKIWFNRDGCCKFVRRKAWYVYNWKIKNASMF